MKNIFVWTFGDIVGLVFLALFAPFAAFIGLLVLWDKVKRKFRRKAAR